MLDKISSHPFKALLIIKREMQQDDKPILSPENDYNKMDLAYKRCYSFSVWEKHLL